MYFNFRFPAERLLQQIKGNPDFNTKLTQLSTDERGDLLSTMDHSNSKELTWLF